MAANSVQIPPIRTNLKDPDITDQTAKEWYLYWKRSGDRINVLNRMLGFGNHGDRPLPGDAPEGALYVEEDRGNTIYANLGGRWLYAAGTMWGTLSPDQRPTDLGAADVGFDFRTSVPPAREFIWSGGRWIEVTALRYGTHAERLAAPVADLWWGMAWMETDRGNVIYQNQAGVWVYVAGVMAAVLASRPTDLGTNDNGFRFEATDTRQTFRWSGSAWIETSFVGGAANLTHPNVVTKVSSTSGQIVEGGITDESAANSNYLHVTATGNVGVGAGSAVAYPLHVVRAESSASLAGIQQFAIGTIAGLPQFSLLIGYGNPGIGANVGAIQSWAGGGAQLLLNPSGGAVGIGYSNPGYLLQLGSDSAGKPGTNTWSIVSDTRVKQNVEPLVGGLDIINRLEPIVAEYNGKAGTPADSRVVSLDPAKLREILPHAVSSVRGKLDPADQQDTDILSVNTHEILYHLVLAVQQIAKKGMQS